VRCNTSVKSWWIKVLLFILFHLLFVLAEILLIKGLEFKILLILVRDSLLNHLIAISNTFFLAQSLSHNIVVGDSIIHSRRERALRN
jgi:hypothetical protein